MGRQKILDDIQLTYDFNELLDADETIIWADRPEAGKLNLSMENVFAIIAFFFFFIISFLPFFKLLIIGCVLSFLFMIRPLILVHFTKKNTQYALTNKRLFFKLWKWSGSKVFWLDLDQIDHVKLDEENDERGTLYFFVNKQSNFYSKRRFSTEKDVPQFITRNIASREQRHCPTFEFIPFAKETANHITAQIKLIKGSTKKNSTVLVPIAQVPESELKLRNSFDKLLDESTPVEWAAKPDIPISFLENPARTPLSLSLNLLGLIGLFVAFFLYNLGGVNYFLPILIFQLIIFFAPDPYRRLKASKTRYALTSSKLYFKIWHMWSTKIESIDIADIDKIGLDEKKEGKGTLFLQLKDESEFFLDLNGKKKKFETRDFEHGSKQLFPTLEFVPDARQLRDAIMEKKKELVKLENNNK